LLTTPPFLILHISCCSQTALTYHSQFLRDLASNSGQCQGTENLQTWEEFGKVSDRNGALSWSAVNHSSAPQRSRRLLKISGRLNRQRLLEQSARDVGRERKSVASLRGTSGSFMTDPATVPGPSQHCMGSALAQNPPHMQVLKSAPKTAPGHGSLEREGRCLCSQRGHVGRPAHAGDQHAHLAAQPRHGLLHARDLCLALPRHHWRRPLLQLLHPMIKSPACQLQRMQLSTQSARGKLHALL